MLPEEVELTDQAMPTPEGRLRTENCLVPDGATVAVAGLTLDDSIQSHAGSSQDAVEELFAVTVIVV